MYAQPSNLPNFSASRLSSRPHQNTTWRTLSRSARRTSSTAAHRCRTFLPQSRRLRTSLSRSRMTRSRTLTQNAVYSAVAFGCKLVIVTPVAIDEAKMTGNDKIQRIFSSLYAPQHRKLSKSCRVCSKLAKSRCVLSSVWSNVDMNHITNRTMPRSFLVDLQASQTG